MLTSLLLLPKISINTYNYQRETTMSSEPKPTPPYVNTTVKQYPKRITPLANGMIAPGFYLTPAGTVAPVPKPPVIEEEE